MTDEVEEAFLSSLASGDMILILGDLGSSTIFPAGGGPATLESLNNRLLIQAGISPAAAGSLSLRESMEFARRKIGNKANELITELLDEGNEMPQALWQLLSGPFERIYDLGAQGGYEKRIKPELRHEFEFVRENGPLAADPKMKQVVPIYGDATIPSSVTFQAPATDGLAAWLRQLHADILTRPILVVSGTSYRELWELFALTPTDRPATIRRRSFWVSDTDHIADTLRLEHRGIARFDLDCLKFAKSFLSPGRQEVLDGRRALNRIRVAQGAAISAREVDGLDRNGNQGRPWDFLRGFDPKWADVTDGKTVRFQATDSIVNQLGLDNPVRARIVIHGRAGSGKTALLMQLAMELKAKDFSVYWIDRQANQSLTEIVNSVVEIKPDVLMVDNIDLFGEQAGEALRRFNIHGKTLVIASVRSTMEWTVNNALGVKHIVWDQSLTDDDIRELDKRLEKAGLLAHLVSVKPKALRREKIREICQRDLLAALIEIVTGMPFEKRINSEYNQLKDLDKKAYRIACFSAAKIFEAEWLPESHLLQFLTNGDPGVEHVMAIENLLYKRLLIRSPEGVKARHRSIADAVIRGLLSDKALVAEMCSDMLLFYARGGAAKLAPNAPNRRRLVSLLSHTLMVDLKLSPTAVREIYAKIQPYLQDDRHFWLQRGAFEVERGDLDLARIYLSSARSSAGGDVDFKITTEWGLLQLARATKNPDSPTAQRAAFDALRELEDVARQKGDDSPHTFTVIIRDGTRWINGSNIPAADRLKARTIISDMLELARKVVKSNREVVRVVEAHTKEVAEWSRPDNGPEYPM